MRKYIVPVASKNLRSCFSPILAIITSVGGLLTALYADKSRKDSQSVVVRGNRNRFLQQSETATGELERNQKMKVKGDDNETTQELGT